MCSSCCEIFKALVNRQRSLKRQQAQDDALRLAAAIRERTLSPQGGAKAASYSALPPSRVRAGPDRGNGRS